MVHFTCSTCPSPVCVLGKDYSNSVILLGTISKRIQRESYRTQAILRPLCQSCYAIQSWLKVPGCLACPCSVLQWRGWMDVAIHGNTVGGWRDINWAESIRVQWQPRCFATGRDKLPVELWARSWFIFIPRLVSLGRPRHTRPAPEGGGLNHSLDTSAAFGSKLPLSTGHNVYINCVNARVCWS